MSNLLIATMPVPDHVNPMLAIARKLLERGRMVRLKLLCWLSD